jgi:hypothetical protein
MSNDETKFEAYAQRIRREETDRKIREAAGEAKYAALAGRILRAETDKEVLEALASAKFLSERSSCYYLAGKLTGVDGNKIRPANFAPRLADLLRKMCRDRSLPDYLITVLDVLSFDWQIPPHWSVALEFGDFCSIGEGGFDSLAAALEKVEQVKLKPRRVEGRRLETIVVEKSTLVNHHGGYDGSPEMKTEKVGRWERRSFKAGWVNKAATMGEFLDLISARTAAQQTKKGKLIKKRAMNGHNWKDTTPKDSCRWSAVCRDCGTTRQMAGWDNMTDKQRAAIVGIGYRYADASRKALAKAGECAAKLEASNG